MIKTYTLTRLYTLVLPVSTRSGVQIVEFKGVQNMKMRGQFTTNETELQTVLESQPEYKNGVYRITAQVSEACESRPEIQKEPEATSATKPASKTISKKPAPPTLFT